MQASRGPAAAQHHYMLASVQGPLTPVMQQASRQYTHARELASSHGLRSSLVSQLLTPAHPARPLAGSSVACATTSTSAQVPTPAHQHISTSAQVPTPAPAPAAAQHWWGVCAPQRPPPLNGASDHSNAACWPQSSQSSSSCCMPPAELRLVGSPPGLTRLAELPLPAITRQGESGSSCRWVVL
jgi:hypothetical protein